MKISKPEIAQTQDFLKRFHAVATNGELTSHVVGYVNLLGWIVGFN